jgi:hypothetical protein
LDMTSEGLGEIFEGDSADGKFSQVSKGGRVVLHWLFGQMSFLFQAITKTITGFLLDSLFSFKH